MGAQIVLARRVIHPGKPRAERVLGAIALRPRRAMVWLPETRSLYDGLVASFARFDVRAGALQLLGGNFAAAAYHVAFPTPDSVRAAEYGPPIPLAKGTRLIRASGSFGEDLSGRPLLHIHGVLADPTGRVHGGHIAPERCIVGPEGVRAILLLSVGFKQSVDRETGYSLFFPFSEVPGNAAVDYSEDHHGARRQRAVRA
jgi:predicted DNA-binding protein with PD1-like motif